MPSFRNTIVVNASRDQVWSVLGDLARVDTWIEGIVGVKVDGNRRVCTFANGVVQHEEITDYSAEDYRYRYSIEGGPLPLKLNRGRFEVETQGEGALIIWDAEVETLDPQQEAQILQMLDGAYKQTIESLRQRIENR